MLKRIGNFFEVLKELNWLLIYFAFYGRFDYIIFFWVDILLNLFLIFLFF